jgi:hypothetical protein
MRFRSRRSTSFSFSSRFLHHPWDITIYLFISVVDQHHVDADPDADLDSTYHPDPDSDFYFMRILMQIRIFI